jgi:hypothetical protein
MNLLDHFCPPLSVRRHWHAFHNAWSTYLASHLNEQLPEGYFAEPNVQFGIEIDVATFEEGNGHAQSLRPSWQVPAPTQTIPISVMTDIVEVLVYSREGGPLLAGAIELVSPANKDRPDHREAFVSKCAAYIQQGIGLLIVDVVTDRLANLHEALLARLNPSQPASEKSSLYTSAYRLVEHEETPKLEMWYQPLAVGETLPTMPLWLRGSQCLAVDLHATYERTCREQRIA